MHVRNSLLFIVLLVAVITFGLLASSVAFADEGFNVEDNFSPSAAATANAGADASAGALAGALSDSSAGVFGSGNSQNENTNVGIQGQLGVLTSDTNVELNPTTFSLTKSSNTNALDSSQSMDQTSVGEVGVDSHDSVNVGGDTYEASRFPVSTAAPVFAGNCSQGVSGQWMGGGGSVASGNPVCDLIAVAGAYIAAGHPNEALVVLKDAEKAAKWRSVFSRIRSVLTLGLL